MNKSINFSLILLAILAFSAMVLMPVQAKAVCWEGWSNCTVGSDNYGTNYGNGNTYSSNNLNPAPAVYDVTPNSIPANVTGNIQVTLTGYNFIPTSLAEFNNSFRSTTYRDSQHLDVTLNDSDLHTIGSYVITVFNPMPGGGMSNGVAFNVNSGSLSRSYGNSNPVVVTYSKPRNYYTAPANNAPSIVPAAGNSNDSYGSLTANAVYGQNGFAPSGIVQWIVFAILMLLIVILVRRVFGFNDKYQKSPMKHA